MRGDNYKGSLKESLCQSCDRGPEPCPSVRGLHISACKDYVDGWVAEAKREADHRVQCAIVARFCPVCGQDCGAAEFEPDDPSVGINGVLWANECPDHGLYAVYDDGDVSFD